MVRGTLRGIREAMRPRRGLAVAGAAVVLAAAGVAGCGGGSSDGGGSSSTGGSSTTAKAGGGYSVVLSNAYMGNAWRKTMVKNFTAAAEQAKQQGLLKDFDVLITQDNKPTDQIAQLQTQLLKRPDAIIINAASPTALNPVIEKACAQGIKVIVFDSLATAPCAYKLNHNLEQLGQEQGEFIGRQLKGRGNVIELRGISGSEPDIAIHNGIQAGLKQFPGIKVVATVDGEASQTTAQQAVQSALRSLPNVDAVMTQGGGDAFGVIQAFESSGKPVPPIVLGSGGNELKVVAGQAQEGRLLHALDLDDARPVDDRARRGDHAAAGQGGPEGDPRPAAPARDRRHARRMGQGDPRERHRVAGVQPAGRRGADPGRAERRRAPRPARPLELRSWTS